VLSSASQNGKLVSLSKDEVKQLNELHLQEGKSQRLIKPKWGVDLGFEGWGAN